MGDGPSPCDLCLLQCHRGWHFTHQSLFLVSQFHLVMCSACFFQTQHWYEESSLGNVSMAGNNSYTFLGYFSSDFLLLLNTLSSKYIFYWDHNCDFINPKKFWVNLNLYHNCFYHMGIQHDLPTFSTPFMTLKSSFLYNPAHFMDLQLTCSCFVALLVIQIWSFHIVFSKWLMLLLKEDTDFLLSISHLMTLLNFHLFQLFFLWVSWDFLEDSF